MMPPRNAAAIVCPMLCALLLTVAAGAGSDPSDDVIRVGTWNLHRFGQAAVPRSTEDLRRMAGHVAAQGVHVLAVQEVVVTRLGENGEPRSYAMDELVAILADEYGQIWDYWLHRQGNDLQLGFMWRQDVVQLHAAPVMGVSAKKVAVELTDKKGKTKSIKQAPFDHFPVMAHVSTGDGLTDFTLLNVHLKGPEPLWGKESFWEARRAACESLASWMEGVWNPGKAAPTKGKKSLQKSVPKMGLPVVGAMSPPLTGGPAFKPKIQAQVQPWGPDVKALIAHLDPDVAVLGMINAPVQPQRDTEPLLDLGLHLLGSEEPTHAGGDALSRILVSVAMGEEHALAGQDVPPGQALVISPSPGQGGSPHHLVSFVVPVRADDD